MTKLTAVILFLMLSISFAQTPPKKKAHLFRGKVEQVNLSTKSVTVNHEKVEGWMDAMTMAYAVDKESILKELKPGDQIKATVYEDDFTLYEIQKDTPKK